MMRAIVIYSFLALQLFPYSNKLFQPCTEGASVWGDSIFAKTHQNVPTLILTFCLFIPLPFCSQLHWSQSLS